MKSSSAGALLFAIITALVLSLVASTFVLLASSQYRVVDNEVDRIIKYYRAQAGMEWAIYQAYTNPDTSLPANADTLITVPPPAELTGLITITIRYLGAGGLSPYQITVKAT